MTNTSNNSAETPKTDQNKPSENPQQNQGNQPPKPADQQK
jgi:hypothetical protein